MIAQGIGILLEAPFVVLCALTNSTLRLPVSLTLWGLSRGLYEANIFASVFDVVRPEARGTATGCMNTMGWLVGGGLSPIVVGLVAERQGLSMAIAVTASSYVLAGLLLFTGVLFFVKGDTAKMEPRLPPTCNLPLDTTASWPTTSAVHAVCAGLRYSPRSRIHPVLARHPHCYAAQSARSWGVPHLP